MLTHGGSVNGLWNMSLEIEQRDREGIVILDMKGRITMGDEVTGFRTRIQEFAGGATDPKVILNLQHIEYIDSTGLGALVMGSSAVRNQGGTIKLLYLNRRNLELLVATKLAVIFEIFNDEQEAVNSFFPDREIKPFDILEFVKTQKQG
jgi:anti-sigma B factor antagonist